jgi:hypothetical protein
MVSGVSSLGVKQVLGLILVLGTFWVGVNWLLSILYGALRSLHS